MLLTIRLVELIIAALLITQVIFPLINGTPLLPLFRRRRSERLLSEAEHARQDLIEDGLEDELAELVRKHNEHKKGPNAE